MLMLPTLNLDVYIDIDISIIAISINWPTFEMVHMYDISQVL